MTDQQQKILNALTEHGELTKSELLQIVGSKSLDNKSKHFGQVLERMVDKMQIKRVKYGVYALDKSNYKKSLFP